MESCRHPQLLGRISIGTPLSQKPGAHALRQLLGDLGRRLGLGDQAVAVHVEALVLLIGDRRLLKSTKLSGLPTARGKSTAI